MRKNIRMIKKHSKWKQWFLELKLKQKVRYLFLLIISIYLIVFFILYSVIIKKNMLNYTLENNWNTMISISNNLNAELNTISHMSQLIMNNKDVISYLKNTEKQELRYAHNAVSVIHDITNVFNNISSVFIFKNDKTYINVSNGITKVNEDIMLQSGWYKEIKDRSGGYVIRINGGGLFTTLQGKPVITLLRVINDLETQKPIGMIAINVSTYMLEQTYKDVNNKYFCYYDNKSNLLSSKVAIEELQNVQFGKEQFNQKTIGNNAILSYYRIPNTPFIITAYEKLSFGKVMSEETGKILFIVTFITILSLIFISLFISRYITTPIERLVQSMDSVKTGWLRRLSLSLPNDEIGDLKDSYNEMLVEINSLINKLLEKEKVIQKAELEVLQEQMKPHFLYNTLETIEYLALTGSKESVYDALHTLGNFYRKFLSKGSKEISIATEISIVKDYLKLQKLRYGDIFEDIYEVEKELLEIYIPKLILQPLVENSLYHGIRLKGEKGIIKISVYSKEDYIYIEVYDNGIGMSEEKLEKIIHEEDHKSFGIKGTMERIKYYYNQEDVFKISSKEGEYTKIYIKIPWNRGI